MSVIAPKFKLSYFIKSLTDNIFWIIVILTLTGIPLIQIVLFYVDLPVLDGELLTPFLAFTMLFHPEIWARFLKAGH
jgi:NADH-quinone oxidoreductase subunit H